MTYKEAMLLLIEKTSHAVEAAKIIRAIDEKSNFAQRRAEKLILVAVNEDSNLSKDDRKTLQELLQQDDHLQERRTETIRFRCTPNERAALTLLAAKHTNGNLSALILNAIKKAYPTK